MRSHRHILPLLGLLIVTLEGCSGCLEPSSGSKDGDLATSTRAKTTLVLGTTQEPDTLDPLLVEVAGAREIIEAIERDLTRYEDDGLIHPSLAARLPEVRTSTRGTMLVRWTLADRLCWSDGRAVVADDFVFTHELLLRGEIESPAVSDARRMTRVRAIDPKTLEVEWAQNNLDYAAPRIHIPLPRHAYPKGPAAAKRGMGREPLANGPYRLASWVPGQTLTLERNPYWPGPTAMFERIVWRFFETEDAFAAELITGGIDALGEASGLSVGKAKALAGQLADSHVVEFVESGVWLHLGVRHDDPVTGRIEVRRAIDRAIDRAAMALAVYEGEATPAGGVFPPRHPAYLAPASSFDPEAAMQLLKEAGWRRDEEGWHLDHGPPMRLALMFASGSEAGERAATFLQSSLEHIGVSVELRGLPFRVLFEKMKKGEQSALSLFAWRLHPDWEPSSVLRSDGSKNFGRYKDEQMDALLDQALSATSSAARQIAQRATDARYRKTLPSIPLLFRRSATIRPRSLTGWRPTGTITPVTWNAESWRWHRP